MFPGAGMMVMALEAAGQTATANHRPLSGFQFKNAQFLASIPVPESSQDAVETTIELRPTVQSANEKDASWSEVRIFTHADNCWKLCFTSEVQVQFEEATNTGGLPPDSDWTSEERLEKARIRRRFQSTSPNCTRQVESRSFYHLLGKSGPRYGPSFQLLREIKWDGHDGSAANIDLAKQGESSGETSPLTPVHPAVLDSMLQLVMMQISRGMAETVPTFVPQKISKAWISAKPWNRITPLIRLCSSGQRTGGALVGAIGSVFAVDRDLSPLCSIDNIAMAQISASNALESGEDASHASNVLLHNISWKPQLSSLSPEELQQICCVNTKGKSETDDPLLVFYPKIERAMRISAHRTLSVLGSQEKDNITGYLKKYLAALEHWYGSSLLEDTQISEVDLEALLRECETERPAWRMFPAVARALSSILKGETNPLEILFSEKAADDFYAECFGTFSHDPRIRTFLDLATHEKPGLRILEIGAGTGSITRSVIGALQSLELETGQMRFSEYTYTDVSPSFFEEARQKFHQVADRMVFRTLDMETSFSDQGFGEASYDLVVAGSVLHVASHLVTTLADVHRLLVPGGHFFLLELTALDSACVNIGFGSLEGWWLGTEDWRRRQFGPLATEQQWNDLLLETGFSGLDLTVRLSHSDETHLTSVMVSRSVAIHNKPYSESPDGRVRELGDEGKEVVFLIDPQSELQRHMADELGQRIPSAHRTRVTPLDLARPGEHSPESIVVCLLEFGSPRLASLDESDFRALQSHWNIHGVQKMLWVTAAASVHGENSCMDPHYALSTGFLRSLRTEQDNKHIVTLFFESCSPGSETGLVSKVLNSCFLGSGLDRPQKLGVSKELEFVVRNGQLTIGRLMEERQLDAQRVSRTRPNLVSEPWGNPGDTLQNPRLVLEVGRQGMLDTLRFTEARVPGQLPADEVEMEAAVWPISFRDVLIALGRMENTSGLGFECAGTVTRVGSACDTKFLPGDRVVMISPSAMGSHPRAHCDAVCRIPAHMSFHDAVAGLNPGMTAWHALSNVARLQAGETVLIHSAAGSTGQMAVKIAKMLGAVVYVTVGSPEKRELVMDPVDGLGIPASNIFFSRNSSFLKGVMEATGGRGVDVVLNSLSGSRLHASWECVAPYGRFVEMGKADITANTRLGMAGFANNVSFTSIDLHHIATTNRILTRQLVEKTLQLTARPDVGGPRPLHFFPTSKVERALRYVQGGKNTGRVLVAIYPQDVVPVSDQ